MVVLHPPSTRPAIIVFVKKFIAPVLALALSGCGGVLDPRGPVGASEKLILIDSLAIMLAIVVPVILATLAFAWWFRASNTPGAPIGRIGLSPGASRAHRLGHTGAGDHLPRRHRLVRVAVARSVPAARQPGRSPSRSRSVSLDWKWLFIYPDEGIATVNQLVVPAGTPLHFRLTSASV